MQREFDILKVLKHDNIVGFFGRKDVAKAEKSGEPEVNLIMELCQADLSRLLKAKKKLSPEETAFVMKQILEGLDYLHESNVIHKYDHLSHFYLCCPNMSPILFQGPEAWQCLAIDRRRQSRLGTN